MSLHLSIIEDKVQDLMKEFKEGSHLTFLKLVHSLITDSDYDDLDLEDIVDGADEKQLDAICIDDDEMEDFANITIIQAKYVDSFQTNYLTLLGNGLQWVFRKTSSAYEKLANKKLIRKIREIRQIRNRRGTSQMRVQVYFATKGDASKLSRDFKQELEQIKEQFTGVEWHSFDLQPVGASELISFLQTNERRGKKISDELTICYDVNKPSYIRYTIKGRKGLVCTVPGREIARLVSGDRAESIFDLNIRKFYGIDTGRVNPDIAATCSDADECLDFWFFNNGITIVCDRFDVVDESDNPHVKLENIQVVNGCQTSMTLAAQQEKRELQKSVNVLVKIFETSDERFVGRIVQTTNNQNTISSRDLKANDPVQIDYQHAFKEIYCLHWERKPREFASFKGKKRRAIINNEKAGQAFLAVVKKNPTTARARKYRIWSSELYRQVFPRSSVERHLLAYRIYEFCLRQKKAELEKWEEDDFRYSIVSYGIFHLARVLAFKFTGKESWDDPDETKAWIKQIDDNPELLRPHYKKSIGFLNKIVKKLAKGTDQINNVFKASAIERECNRKLGGEIP